MDMYNDASMLLDGNFDDPRLTDYDLLLENLADLKAGKTIEAPVYSFKESRRVGTRTVECPESNIIIVEGIYALSDKLRPLQDLRISISGGVHFDLVKRVMRDIDRSGQAPEDIIHQISEDGVPHVQGVHRAGPSLRSPSRGEQFQPFRGVPGASRSRLAPRATPVDFLATPPRSRWNANKLRYLPICGGSRDSLNNGARPAPEDNKP